MIGMRKIHFGIYGTLLLTCMRILGYINETLYTKGFVIIAIAVIGGNVAEYAKDLLGIFTIKKSEKMEEKHESKGQ